MKIQIKKTGEVVELTENKSLSGKTTTYNGIISIESYTALMGYEKLKKNYIPGISLNENLTQIEVNTGSPYGGSKGLNKTISIDEIDLIK